MKVTIILTEKQIVIRRGRSKKAFKKLFTLPEHQQIVKLWLQMIFRKP